MQTLDPKSIGRRICELRENLGISQTVLASRLGPQCTQGRISRWENGLAVPETEYVARLSAELGVTIEQLLSGYATQSMGVDVTNEQLKALRETPEWAELPATKRQALVQLLGDTDVEDYEVRSVVALLQRGLDRTK